MKPLWIVGGLAAAVGGYMYWSRSKADAAPKTPVAPIGPGVVIQKQLELPITGIRWYPITIAEVGNVPGDTRRADLGSDVYFGVEYGPTEDRRLVAASVVDRGLYEGEPSLIATVVDETPMVQLSDARVPVGTTLLIRVADLVSPAIWTQAKAMEVSV